MDAQAIIAQLQQTLRDAGMPVTTDNLNRAMLALSRGEAMERAEQRTQPARPRGQAATPQGGETASPALAATGEAAPASSMEAIVQQQVEATAPPATEVAPSRGDRVAAQELPVRRGSMPRAQRIDEENPEAGMYGNEPPRQAVDVDDPVGMALGMGSIAAGGLAAAIPRAAPMLGITMNRPQAPQAMLPAPTPALPGPQGAAALPAPAPRLAAPQMPAQPPMQRLQDGISVGMPQARTGQAIPAAENVTPLTGRMAASAAGPAGNATFQAAREAARRGGPRGQRSATR